MNARLQSLRLVFYLLLSSMSNSLSVGKDIIFDAPVSNHGARLRIISRMKKINENIEIKNPSEVGGLKSLEFAKYSIQGKMPILVTDDGFSIVESDCIANYLLEKYKKLPPSFVPNHIYQKSLSEQICRVHDMYISPIQACMYRAPGSIFSSYGTNRPAALNELKRQLRGIETMLSSIDGVSTQGAERPFLCGSEISLADAALFPTVTFCNFMLPQFFNWNESEYLGPRLSIWYKNLSEIPEVKSVQDEILGALESWKQAGRWDPIIQEMNASSSPSKL